MFRTYIINQLTQASTWYGIIIMIGALFFPSTWVLVIGILITMTDDSKMQKFFAGMRKEIEGWWLP